MKVLAVFSFILSLSILINVSMDLLLGYKFPYEWSHVLNPFWVLKGGEYVMVVFLIFIIIGNQVILFMKNRDRKQKGSS